MADLDHMIATCFFRINWSNNWNIEKHGEIWIKTFCKRILFRFPFGFGACDSAGPKKVIDICVACMHRSCMWHLTLIAYSYCIFIYECSQKVTQCSTQSRAPTNNTLYVATDKGELGTYIAMLIVFWYNNIILCASFYHINIPKHYGEKTRLTVN